MLMRGCRQPMTKGRVWDAPEELEEVSRKRKVGTGYVEEDGLGGFYSFI